jgi:single-strand DNA-binding protein
MNMIASVVTGNAGRDAELKDVNGTPVMSFSLASRRYEKGEEKTDWVDVSFWGQRATKLTQYVTKGSRLAIRGTVWMREFTHNGEKRQALAMRADDIELMGSNEKTDRSDAHKGGGVQRTSYDGPSAEDLPF